MQMQPGALGNLGIIILRTAIGEPPNLQTEYHHILRGYRPWQRRLAELTYLSDRGI